MCQLLFKLTIAQYNHNGSQVFVAFIEVLKAFNKVNHRGLFKKLLESKVPLIFVHLLARWYSSKPSCVTWKSAYFESFSTTKWSKARQHLEPFLFVIYMKELLLTSNKLNIGCVIGNRCLNNIMHADDTCCLAGAWVSKNFLIFVVIMQIDMILLLTVLKLKP